MANNGDRVRCMKDAGKKYMQCSSLHGMKYIVDREAHVLERYDFITVTVISKGLWDCYSLRLLCTEFSGPSFLR